MELELDVLANPALVIDPAVGIANAASVSTATTDPNPGDNTSTFTASGQAQADLSIRKIAPSPDRAIFPVPAPVAGEHTSYVLEIINFGPSEAPNPVIKEVLPPGMTFVRAFEPVDPVGFTYDFCTGDGANPETVTCVLPFAFPAFVGTNLGIEVAIDPTVRDGTVLTNTASMASDAADGNTGNNTSGATVAVRAVTNLRVEKHVVEMDAGGNIVRQVPDNEVLGLPPGHAVSFIVQVTNDGPSAAADVQFIDSFPPDAASFPVGDCQFPNKETVCRYSNSATGDLLLPGDAFGVQLITIPVGDTPPGIYTNTARATTSTQETNLADNVDARDIQITDPVADLVIDKAAVTTPLVAGQTVHLPDRRVGRPDRHQRGSAPLELQRQRRRRHRHAAAWTAAVVGRLVPGSVHRDRSGRELRARHGHHLREPERSRGAHVGDHHRHGRCRRATERRRRRAEHGRGDVVDRAAAAASAACRRP